MPQNRQRLPSREQHSQDGLPGAIPGDGRALGDALRAATGWLEQHAAEIDRLNVFPVRDGDTGANMHATMCAALREVEQCRTSSGTEVARAAARGALIGARGDSGLILAQLLGGLAKAVEGGETIGAAEVAAALTEAAARAYHGVVKPVPGTIVTVCGDAARAAASLAARDPDPRRVLAAALAAARESLARTPSQLPALREAGVVDAGGMGFVVLLEAIVCFASGEAPGVACELRVSCADPVPAPPIVAGRRIAVVAVVTGAGLAAEFWRHGVTGIVAGGQTMNPSAEEILRAVEASAADEVIVLPNNGNVILAANQAADLAAKRVAVVPCHSVAQGFGALRAFDDAAGFEANVAGMARAAMMVRTIEVTTAVRDARAGDLVVLAEDVIALLDGCLVATGATPEEAALKTLAMIEAGVRESVTIYYGHGVSRDRAARLAQRVCKAARWQEAEGQVLIAEGGQPHYSYVIAVV